MLDAPVGCRSFVRRRGEAGHADRTHLVVGDDAAFGFLNLDDLAELRRLGRLAFADHLGVWPEDAEHLVRVMRIAVHDAGARLREHAEPSRAVASRWPRASLPEAACG